MRISDWSSDVCSSDLVTIGALPVGELAPVLHEPVSAHRRVGAHLGFKHHRSNGVHGAPFGGGVDQAVVAIERAAHIARGIGLDDIESHPGCLARGALVGKLGAALSPKPESAARREKECTEGKN